MLSCDICFQAAMQYGGNVERETVDGVRHWKPKTLWKNREGSTNKPKLDTTRKRIIFCMIGKNVVIDTNEPDFRDNKRGPIVRNQKRGIPIA